MVYAYILPTYPVAFIIQRITLLLGFFVALRVSMRVISINGDIFAILIFLASLVEALVGIMQIIQGYSRNNIYPITGTFLNPGPFGAFVSCGFVMLFALKKKYEFILKSIDYYSIIRFVVCLLEGVMAVALFLSASRSSILALAICLWCMFYYRVRKYSFFGGFFFVILLIALYFLKKESADGRIVIWAVSLYNIVCSPLCGYGVGSFLHQYAEGMEKLYYMLNSQIIDTNVVHFAFNGLFHVVVEQGIIGLLFFLMILLYVSVNFKRSELATKWILPLLLMTSMSSYTLELLPFQIFMVIALTSIVPECNSCCYVVKRSKVMSFFLVSLLLICICTVTVIEKHLTAKMEYNRIKGKQAPEYVIDYYPLLSHMDDNPEFLFDFAKALYNSNRFNDSNAILHKGSMISADPLFYILKGRNYEGMGDLMKAERFYIKGFTVMPNRIYPLYRLLFL